MARTMSMSSGASPASASVSSRFARAVDAVDVVELRRPSLSPSPASIEHRAARRATSSGRIASVIRLRSSAGACFCHSGFGTTPNIAPPSRRKKPSQSEISSRLPSAKRRDRSSRAWPSRRARRTARARRLAACFSSTSTPCALDGWMNATSAPSAPGRGVSSISRTPRCLRAAPARRGCRRRAA